MLQNRLHAQNKKALKFVVESLEITVEKDLKDTFVKKLIEWVR